MKGFDFEKFSGSLLGLVFFLGLAACNSERKYGWDEKPDSIRLVLHGEKGSPTSPLPATSEQSYLLDLEVLSASGRVLEEFDGLIHIFARPGRVSLGPSSGAGEGYLHVVGGRATAVPLVLSGAFGRTVIWAEDLGFRPHSGLSTGACSNGIDDDGDGRTDYPFDTGCYNADDDSEEGGSMASGASEPLWFTNPPLSAVQGRGALDPSVSPYQGEFVTIDSGFLVVTRITRDGMNVTDIADPGGYNHIYVYNFNTPAGVRICDRLLSLSGTVGEYYKFTELNFPSWTLDPWRPEKGPCPIPEPYVLSPSDLSNKAFMEGLEAALVRVEDVLVGDQVVDCDLNKDGKVDYRDYNTNSCNEECQCREACEANPLCTEMTQYKAYGQWAVAVGGANGKKLLVVSQDAMPYFDPFGPGHPRQLKSLTGTIRNMSFLKPPYILEPRCPDDLVVSGQPKPIWEACVSPRTGEEEEPN